MTARIGVDIGGTFTDILLYDESTGETYVTKSPTTPDALEEGVIDGVSKVLEAAGVEPADVSYLSHGTTVGTNAILEEEFPRVGLVTNDGFRDVVEIGDQRRPEIYNLFTEKPTPLVPRFLREEVPGRIDQTGEVIEPLDESAAERAIESLADEGVESVVVALLFSYRNDHHEQRIGELIDRTHPDLEYTLSAENYPEIREYDRTITTVLNEIVRIVMRDYLERLEESFRELGVTVPLNIMHSGGGIFGRDAAQNNAVRTILSGPAAGAVAVRDVAADEGFSNAIGMDMGGTSADVSIVRDGELVRTTGNEINRYPILTPMIDINTVGAGGGSIAWIDEGGILRVGPESAGSDPGPICYGRGGTEPTVTDANLLLGRIDPDAFVDGDIAIAVEKTRRLFEEQIADVLGESVPEAAHSVLRIANARLTRNIRNVTVEQGHDPAEFVLVSFGGAGPLHAPSVARQMNLGSVLIPRNPGVFSARGLLTADVRIDESRSQVTDRLDAESVGNQFADLRESLLNRLAEQGLEHRDFRISHAVDMRYRGQSYSLTVPLEEKPDEPGTVDRLREAFRERHRQRYGFAMQGEPVELVTYRSTALLPTPRIGKAPQPSPGDPHREDRDVYFADSGFVTTGVFERHSLSVGETIEGPAIIEDEGSTSIVPPAHRIEVTEFGNLLLSS